MENENKDDEISLIDLFAVLLRYRKMIIIITLCTVVLAAAMVLFRYIGVKDNPVYQGQMTVRADQNVLRLFNQSVVELTTYFFNRNVLLDAFQKAGMTEYEYKKQRLSLTDNADREMMLSVIDNELINQKIESGEPRIFQVSSLATGSDFEITFRNEDSEFIRIFFNIYINVINEIMEDRFVPMAENNIILFENMFDTFNLDISQSIPASLQAQITQYYDSKEYLTNKPSLLISEEFFVVEDIAIQAEYKKNLVMKGIIMIFGGAFFSIFLAFVLNTVRNIKKDEEAMKKINDALRKTENK